MPAIGRPLGSWARLPLCLALGCIPSEKDEVSAAAEVGSEVGEGLDSGFTGDDGPSTASASESDGAPSDTGSESLDGGFTGGEGSGESGGLPDCAPLNVDACGEAEDCLPTATDEDDGPWDGWSCQSPEGGGTAGDPCRADLPFGPATGCAPGLVCVERQAIDGGFEGWCAPLCSTQNDSGGDEDPCADFTESSCVPDPSGAFSTCRPHCDPRSPACPETGTRCVLGPDARFVCQGRDSDTSANQQACILATDCLAGLACLSGAVVGADLCGQHASCCTPYCTIGLEECPPSTQCTPMFPPGTDTPLPDLGVCLAG